MTKVRGRNDKSWRTSLLARLGARGNLLSPLRGWLLFNLFIPTACAVGCILSPLRGWVIKMVKGWEDGPDFSA